MVGSSDAPVVVTGLGRNLAAPDSAAPLRVDMNPDAFTVALDGQSPLTAEYRDLANVAVDQSNVLLAFVSGSRVIAEQLGSGLSTLVGELRERRARQMLSDRLIEVPRDERLELVEYEAGDEHGVAQLAFHPWGAALMPLDERRPWRLVRRADISNVAPDQSRGRLRVATDTRPGHASIAFDLLGLGLDTVRMGQRFSALREMALSDAARIIEALMAAAPPQARDRAATLLIDGRPITTTQLGDAWPLVERAVLTEPTFASSYAALSAHSNDDAARWLAIAPVTPTDPTEHKSWFLVGLPGGLLAMELVSEGAHATYLFRATDSYDAAAFDISDCLIDTRFLRSAIYMTDAQLQDAANIRQRLAVAALPSLQAARRRFVGRLIHSDEESWTRNLDDAIKWNGTNRGESARWPGSDQTEGD